MADQVDNLGGSAALLVVLQLLRAAVSLPGVAVVAVTRAWDAEHRPEIKKLIDDGIFRRVNSEPLADPQTRDILARLGILHPNDGLVQLARNLLNLSLIADLVRSGPGPSAALADVHNEVGLWDRYRLSLEMREGPDRQRPTGQSVVAAAVRLATESLRLPDRGVVLRYPEIYEEQRLLSRGVLVLGTTVRQGRFRHEQLRDYFYSWDAVERGRSLNEVLSDAGNREIPKVLQWMCRIGHAVSGEYTARLLAEIVACDRLAHLTKVSVLDAIRAIDVPSDPVLDTAVEMLRKHASLRRYFLGQTLSVAWIRGFHDRGLFSSGLDEDREMVWQLGHVLTAQAAVVPDVVLDVARNHSSKVRFMRLSLLRALEAIPVMEAATVVSVVTEWLEEMAATDFSVHEVGKFAAHLASHGQAPAILPLLRCLLLPIPNPDEKARSWDTNAVSRFGLNWAQSYLSKIVASLAVACPEEALGLFESLLLAAQEIDTATSEYSTRVGRAGWRSAIEPSGQNIHHDLRDYLVDALRDLLQASLATQSAATVSRVQGYLSDTATLLRRIGIHCVRQFPDQFQARLSQMLRDAALLEDSDVHHEYFLLLRDGYPLLGPDDRDAAHANIVDGPTTELRSLFRERWEERSPSDVDRGVERSCLWWRRDRLFMIRDHLLEDRRAYCEALTQELGVPEHPEFTSYCGPVEVKTEVPWTREQLLGLTVEEIAALLRKWRPEASSGGFTFERATISRAAAVLCDAVTDEPQRFAAGAALFIDPLVPGEYPASLLEGLQRAYQSGRRFDWRPVVAFCLELSRADTRPTWWRAEPASVVRSPFVEMIRCLQTGFYGAEEVRIPNDCLDDLATIAVRLFGHEDCGGDQAADDPHTRALNHVQPLGVELSIRVASAVVNGKRGAGILPNVLEALEQKLGELSSAQLRPVQTVIGRNFATLYGLDACWASRILAQVFPRQPSEHDAWRAAFEGYLMGSFDGPSYVALQDEFIRGVRATRGMDIHENFFDSLGLSILFGYLAGKEELPEDAKTGDSAIAALFKDGSPKLRARAMWALWRHLRRDKDESSDEGKTLLDQGYWPRLHAFWSWWLTQAPRHDPAALDEEVQWLARWPLAVKDHASFSVVQPMLVAMMPYLTRAKNGAWEAVEEYLSTQAAGHPVDVLKLYRALMIDRDPQHQSYHRGTPEARLILEAGAADSLARIDTLAIIDWFGSSWGIYDFRDIYERCNSG